MKRRLWIGLAGAVVATGVWWGRTQEKSPLRSEVSSEPRVFVQITGAGAGGADRVLREKAEYFDPTPLFFPTEWNFGQTPLRKNLQQGPGQVFQSYPAKWTDAEQIIKSNLASSTEAPDRLADLLSAGNQTPFGGLGHANTLAASLAERSAYLEIRGLGRRDYYIAQPLTKLTLPIADFQPLEYMATVVPEGLVGELILVSGSGSEEVDSFFRAYLVDSYRVGGRLPPGRYQIQVGP